MIIVCPECSTKFKLNAERIPDGGTKVRCARCKHVFKAEKPVEQESECAPVMEAATPDLAAVEAELPDLSDVPEHESAAPENGPTEERFSYDRFRELDEDREEKSFTFAAEEEEPSDSSDDFSFSGKPEAESGPIEKIITTEQAQQNGKPTATEESATPSRPAESVADPEFPAQAPQKGGTLSAISKVLLILILGLLVVGGILVYMNGPDQLSQTFKQLIGQQTERPAQSGRITLAELEGRFVQNQHAGELFLIRGMATNDYPEPRAGIQVKGVIFDPNGKPLLQKTVFCGNPISEKDLQTLSFGELEKMMGNQFGKELSNMKVDQGQALPFDIVFKDLPQNLSEFSVKVTASKPATK